MYASKSARIRSFYKKEPTHAFDRVSSVYHQGLYGDGETALSIGANTFAFFTRNPRGGNAKALDPADVAGLREILDQHGFATLVAHAPYTYNPCSAKESAREFALGAMAEDLQRMEMLPVSTTISIPVRMWARAPSAASSSLSRPCAR